MKKFTVLMAVVVLAASLVFPASAAVTANPPRGLEEKVMDALKVNTDTRGWLMVPGTPINGFVMQDKPVTGEDGVTKGSHFYNASNFSKAEDPKGIPYIDYRCNMRLGALPRNTVIYGRSETDDPNGEGFAQLKKYLDDDWAAEHPYIYYCDGKNTYTFMVFAVFTTHENLPYNTPALSNDQTSAAEVLSTARELSVRPYENQPSDTARILTLSTTVESVDPAVTYWEPKYYRYVVMAKAIVVPTAAPTR